MQPNTHPGGKLAAITFLTMADRDAVAAHIGALAPDDRAMRFGWSGPASPEQLVRFATVLLQAVHEDPSLVHFGGWDASRQALLYMGSFHCPSPRERTVAEFSMSAVPSARGGLTSEVMAWLIPQLIQRGYRKLSLVYENTNPAVAAIAARHGFQVRSNGGVSFGTLDITPQAQVARLWLEKLDAFLALVRPALRSPGARL
ncbi:MAG: GNAT family N-acetyltransferase [Hydrogenophaga sp.]|uniref:GNAT family N-acetyltransferase n=1 Tax=Hydrogenophaga sp. TaxID=1904254 RepID=UPI0026295F96|nr:hypothetical protein [Hydrogenophaga sp.]MCV0437905.1 GNAT family N-acetyltransferase [Hydrogenophaga sp.]